MPLLTDSADAGLASSSAPTASWCRHPRLWILAGLILFVVGLAAVIPRPEKYFGDETYYTDAVMGMLRTGDYWTPTYPDGRIRLEKPILTYWAIAGSFHVFGINLFASRLPAILAAAGLLMATFGLARTLFGSRRAAFLAAFIAASNLELLRLGARATPDIFVCLFVTLSMLGFARMWFEAGGSRWAPWLALGGMALAVQTKGLLGLVPLLANLVFLLTARPRLSLAKPLLNPALIATAAALGTFWYILMMRLHGLDALRAFSEDQVGAKVSSNPAYLLLSPLFYLTSVVQYFPLWLALLTAAVLGNRDAAAQFWKRHRTQCLFLLSVLMVVIVSFSLGNVRRSRYLTVSYPLLACLFAGALDALAPRLTHLRILARCALVFGGLLVLVGGIVTIAGIALHPRLLAAGLLSLAAGFAGVFLARGSGSPGIYAWFASLFTVGFIVDNAFYRPILNPSPLPILARQAASVESAESAQTVYVLKMAHRVPGLLRILSGGKLRAEEIQAIGAENPLIVASGDPAPLQQAGYRITVIAAPRPISKPPFDKPKNSTCWLGVRPSTTE